MSHVTAAHRLPASAIFQGAQAGERGKSHTGVPSPAGHVYPRGSLGVLCSAGGSVGERRGGGGPAHRSRPHPAAATTLACPCGRWESRIMAIAALHQAEVLQESLHL